MILINFSRGAVYNGADMTSRVVLAAAESLRNIEMLGARQLSSVLPANLQRPSTTDSAEVLTLTQPQPTLKSGAAHCYTFVTVLLQLLKNNLYIYIVGSINIANTEPTITTCSSSASARSATATIAGLHAAISLRHPSELHTYGTRPPPSALFHAFRYYAPSVLTPVQIIL